MDGKETVTSRRSSTSLLGKLRRGPWPEEVIDRLLSALDQLVDQLKTDDAVAGIVLFGSYARGEYGRKSDVDLLIVFDREEPPELTEVGRAVLRLCGEIETKKSLPMHLAPLLADISQAKNLGPAFLHAIWTDGIILYARAGALALLQPTGLAAWILIRFSTVGMSAAKRVKLSRILHGLGTKAGIIRSPTVSLGRGTILAPASHAGPIQAALDVAGASYDVIPVWREI